jgi:hypothetical protein
VRKKEKRSGKIEVKRKCIRSKNKGIQSTLEVTIGILREKIKFSEGYAVNLVNVPRHCAKFKSRQ